MDLPGKKILPAYRGLHLRSFNPPEAIARVIKMVKTKKVTAVDLYKKFAFTNLPSFSLESVAQHETKNKLTLNR